MEQLTEAYSEEECRVLSFSTQVIRAASQKPDVHGAINQPIYRNAAFEFPTAAAMADAFQNRTDAHTYSRISNPTVSNFEEKIRRAAGAENVMGVASGMAAISNTFLTLSYTGGNIISSAHLFGNTFSFLVSTLSDFGVEVRFVDTDNLDEIVSAIDSHTCAFFAELITNPHMEVTNVPEISRILRAHHIPMILDTTIVPWCGFDARRAGVDLEVVSTTKYISGGGTSIGGAIVDYGTHDWAGNKKLAPLSPPVGVSKFMFKLRSEIARNMGACMAPDTAYQQALGLETLEVRYVRMSETAYRLARHLSTHPRVGSVNYPQLENSPYKELSDRLFRGHPGAMLTLSLESREACYRFLDALRLIRRSTNLFDNKTLAIHPESTIYGNFSVEMKRVMGVDDRLIRLSIGLESFDDLRDDLDAALKTL